MSTNRPQLGRRHQRVQLLTARQRSAWTVVLFAAAAFLLWHLTVVLLVGVPVTAVGTTIKALVTLHPISGLTAPATASTNPPPAALVVGVWLGLLLAALGLWALAAVTLAGRSRRRSTVGVARRGQARRSAGEQRARDTARRIRAESIDAGDLDVEQAPLAEVGLELGRQYPDGEPVIVTFEDQVGIIAPTGAGKSVHVIIGACIDSPGPLVVTATSPEILDAIVEPRSGMGRIWVFDWLDIATWPEPAVWDPTAGADARSQSAQGRGSAFAAGFTSDESTDSSNPFFQQAAAIIMSRLLHAASLGGRTMADVISWALDLERAIVPRDVLANDPGAETFWARTLDAAVHGADETMSSVRQTLAQKLEPLLSRTVLRQLVPRPGVAQFDPDAFVTSTDTLVFISDDNQDVNVAPLTTMLLNEVVSAGKRAAAASMYGRLPKPLRIVGDEIANTAPLPKLPGYLSNTRGAGLQWILAFQSVAQVLGRWGEAAGRTMLANLNVSLIMGGLQDEAALERFSVLVGSEDIRQVSATLDASRTVSGQQVSTTERRVMAPEMIRQLPDGMALAIYRNAPPCSWN